MHSSTQIELDSRINAATPELARALIRSTLIEEISYIVLEHAKKLTGSVFGYVGYVDPETGHLFCPTMTRDIWQACKIPDKDFVFETFSGLSGWVLENRESLLTNAAADDPRSSGAPRGHVPIRRFLSAPAMVGEKLVGQVALANPGRDYTERDLELIEDLASLYALAVQSRCIEDELQGRARLKAVLRALRNVNQLLATETDFKRLVRRACDCLVQTRAYRWAWIALTNDAGKLTAMTEAGLDDETPLLCERLARGDQPGCLKRAMSEPGALVIKDPASACTECGLAAQCEADAVMAMRLTHNGKTYGVLTVSVSDRLVGEKERALFEEIAGDIASSLHNIRLAEEHERAQRALRRSNTALKRFARAASYDLQEPLRAITSCLQLLEEAYGDQLDADGLELIRYAADGAVRMREMINGLRTYRRLNRQSEDPRPRKTNCEALFRQVLADLERPIDESGALVTHDQLPTIDVEGLRIRQVLRNLIGNAIKFRREDVTPQVHVSASFGASRGDGEWLFSVWDNGTGIAPEHTNHIFEFFHRLHTHDEYCGAGMGLALCRRIVEDWGGDIWVTSELGVGSTFYFTVPVILDSLHVIGSEAVCVCQTILGGKGRKKA